MFFFTARHISLVLSCTEEADEKCYASCANYLFSDALKKEFIYLQQKGVFQGTEGEADSLSSHIANKIKEYSENQNGLVYNYRHSERDSLDKDSVDAFLAPLYGDEVLAFMDSLRYCSATQFLQNMKPISPAGFRKIAPRTFYAELKQAAPYRAFDLNGNLVDQGMLSGVYKAPMLPLVLKLDGLGSFYLK